ncbi:hypothetical protein IMZ48_44050 [Candidatus Bathyarchaeota archaeon]|nr:hypothetical protein [Candidatus Bathyarchaeota archaeon]
MPRHVLVEDPVDGDGSRHVSLPNRRTAPRSSAVTAAVVKLLGVSVLLAVHLCPQHAFHPVLRTLPNSHGRPPVFLGPRSY